MMNQIILLDGTYGIGKTSVAREVCSINKTYLCLDPDKQFNSNREKYFIFGWPAANNGLIRKCIRNEVENKIQIVNIIIPLTLNKQSYRESWINLLSDITEVRHVILFADMEKVKGRILNDPGRDTTFALEQLYYNENFYRRDTEGAFRINTSDLTINEVAIRILESIT